MPERSETEWQEIRQEVRENARQILGFPAAHEDPVPGLSPEQQEMLEVEAAPEFTWQLEDVEEHAREVRERLGMRPAEYRINSRHIAEYEYIPLSRMHWNQGTVYIDSEPVGTATGRISDRFNSYNRGGYLPPPRTTITVNDSSVITSVSTCNQASITIDTGRDEDMPVVTDHAVLDRITADLRERQQQVSSIVIEALRHARTAISQLEATRDWLAENDLVTAGDAERAKYSARAAREALGACTRQVTSVPSRLTSVVRVATDADNERQRIARERAAAELTENIMAMRTAHPDEYIPEAGDEIRVPGLSLHPLTVRLLREAMNDERVSFVIDEPATGHVYTRSLSALRASGMIRASAYVAPEPVAREVIPPSEAVPRAGDTVIMPHGISGRPSEASRSYNVTCVVTTHEGTVHVTLESRGTHWTRDAALLRQRGMRIERASELVRAEPMVPADLEPGDRFLLRDAQLMDAELSPSVVFTVQDPWAWMEEGSIRFTDDRNDNPSWEASPDDLLRYGIVTLSGGWLPARDEIVTVADANNAQYVINDVTVPSLAGEPLIRFHLAGGDYIYQVSLSRAAEMGIRRLDPQ